MEKIKKGYLKFEEQAVSYVFKNLRRLVIFLIFSFLILYLPMIPYVNLVISRGLVLYVLICLFFIFFKIHSRYIFYIAVFLFVISIIPSILLADIASAEFLANLAYGVVFFGLLKYVFEKE